MGKVNLLDVITVGKHSFLGVFHCIMIPSGLTCFYSEFLISLSLHLFSHDAAGDQVHAVMRFGIFVSGLLRMEELKQGHLRTRDFENACGF